MMKQLWAVAALTILMLAGCSSNAVTDHEKADGKSLYAAKCSACHGGNLKGLVGPPLLNLGSKYSENDLTKIIINGTDMMPGHLLTDEQSKNVAEWLLK
jgi:cytochrome c551